MGVYGSAQGIWVDKTRTTGRFTPSGGGITVSVVHTGASYADDLSETGMLYHYPNTDRPAGRDAAEVAATKAAGSYEMPVFVIVYPSPSSTKRDVHFGWVKKWNDELRLSFIEFGESPPEGTDIEDAPFHMTAPGKSKRREGEVRQGQQEFRFDVLNRYGARCAVCDLTVVEALEAAHIRPWKDRGSDDPRNGLVLCATHHRAWDAGLFGVEPNTLAIRTVKDGPDTTVLRLSKRSFHHLPQKPHASALDWRWQRWRSGTAKPRAR